MDPPTGGFFGAGSRTRDHPCGACGGGRAGHPALGPGPGRTRTGSRKGISLADPPSSSSLPPRGGLAAAALESITSCTHLASASRSVLVAAAVSLSRTSDSSFSLYFPSNDCSRASDTHSCSARLIEVSLSMGSPAFKCSSTICTNWGTLASTTCTVFLMSERIEVQSSLRAFMLDSKCFMITVRFWISRWISASTPLRWSRSFISAEGGRSFTWPTESRVSGRKKQIGFWMRRGISFSITCSCLSRPITALLSSSASSSSPRRLAGFSSPVISFKEISRSTSFDRYSRPKSENICISELRRARWDSVHSLHPLGISAACCAGAVARGASPTNRGDLGSGAGGWKGWNGATSAGGSGADTAVSAVLTADTLSARTRSSSKLALPFSSRCMSSARAISRMACRISSRRSMMSLASLFPLFPALDKENSTKAASRREATSDTSSCTRLSCSSICGETED
mmetsp:Transcript_30223/g.78050  ORF Transcript_30223/g.78050 Transcript_30223/m.78050 type:complete len:457 (-) Transcript_30223:2699-4069(-)